MSETTSQTDPQLDPKTEADPKAEAKSKGKAAKPTSFSYRSVSKEPTEFEVMGVRGNKQPDGYLVWNVPAEDAERFERHIFFVQGRIQKG